MSLIGETFYNGGDLIVVVEKNGNTPVYKCEDSITDNSYYMHEDTIKSLIADNKTLKSDVSESDYITTIKSFLICEWETACERSLESSKQKVNQWGNMMTKLETLESVVILQGGEHKKEIMDELQTLWLVALGRLCQPFEVEEVNVECTPVNQVFEIEYEGYPVSVMVNSYCNDESVSIEILHQTDLCLHIIRESGGEDEIREKAADKAAQWIADEQDSQNMLDAENRVESLRLSGAL